MRQRLFSWKKFGGKESSMLKYLNETTNNRVEIRNINVIGNIGALKRAVVDNMGVSIVSKFAVDIESNLGLLISDIDLERYIFLIKKKSVFLGPSAEVFLRSLMNIVEKNMI